MIEKICKRRDKVNERSLSVLEQYELEVREVFHGRGSFICKTNKGRKLLFPFNGSEARAQLLYKLQLNRREIGDTFVDIPVSNKEGVFISEDMYGNKFLLKDWVESLECNITEEQNIAHTMEALALFHRAFRINEEDKEQFGKFSEKVDSFADLVTKHNSEITKVIKYIRSKNNKNSFEYAFLRVADEFLIQGKSVESKISDNSFDKLYKASRLNGCFNHGDFSYHQALILDDRAVIVNPEHFQCSLQVDDLAKFMRKVMEKNDWNIGLGTYMLECYVKNRSLSNDELSFLKLKLAYPEKFWKLANHYYNSKKTWVSVRQEEKLIKLVEQDNNKQEFLKKIL